MPALLALLACQNPISNTELLADGAFLAALPSDARLESPAPLRNAPDGDALLLDAARDACAEVDDLTATARATTAALTAGTPAERSELLRAWSPTAVTAELDGETRLWWVTVEIVRADAEADLEWTVEASAEKDGDYVLVGEGRHDPAGLGDLTWDLAAMDELLGLDVDPDALAADYDDGDMRYVTLTASRRSLPVSVWVLADTQIMAWTGTLALDGAEPLAATTTAWASPGVGGRATGELVLGEETALFDGCWDATGDTLWLAADGVVEPVGSAASCTVGPL